MENRSSEDRTSKTPYSACPDPEESKDVSCASRPSPKFVSRPLIVLGIASFSFASVLIMYMQISEAEEKRDAGIVFGFYPQILLFGWWFGIDLLVWQYFNIPSGELLCLNSDRMDLVVKLLMSRRPKPLFLITPRIMGGTGNEQFSPHVRSSRHM